MEITGQKYNGLPYYIVLFGLTTTKLNKLYYYYYYHNESLARLISLF